MNRTAGCIVLNLFLILMVFTSGCVSTEKSVGGETDEHGCLLMAGYTWCETKDKCIRNWVEECPSQNKLECELDENCIPLPSDCHPTVCINMKYENDYDKPDVCTEIFMIEAAYKPEDCICSAGTCTNKNLGRNLIGE